MGALSFFLRSESTLQQIEAELVRNYGDMTLACRALRIDRVTVENWREDDPEVEKRLRRAELIGYSTIESVAIERAIKGYEKDVYFQGNVVGKETVYSDTLLKEILKARNLSYQPKQEAPSAVQVNVNVMPRADTYEEWLNVRKATLGQVEEAQYEELPAPDVSPAAAAAYNLMRAEQHEQSALKDLL